MCWCFIHYSVPSIRLQRAKLFREIIFVLSKDRVTLIYFTENIYNISAFKQTVRLVTTII